MSWRTDKLVKVCSWLEADVPRAKRCLVAMRRSGRDVEFNAHLGVRRLQIELGKPVIGLLDFLTRAERP